MLLVSILATLSLAGAPSHALTSTQATTADTPCDVRPEVVPVAERQSPIDSLNFSVGGKTVKVCYGRPSARGRTMIGGKNVPYGNLWRTGANEPTMIHTPVALTIAGLKVPPGTYSLYSVPGASEWTIIVNRSTKQWGEEHGYTPEVKAQEIGRATVKSEAMTSPIETFTIRAEPSGDAASLVLEWGKTRG